MAKKRMVTRTVKQYHVTVKCANTESNEIIEQVFAFTKLPKGNDKILTKVKVQCPETLVPISVVKTENVVQLLGMDEEKFIELAEVLPARNVKAE